MNTRTPSLLAISCLLATGVLAQTQPGSANVVDPYPPTQTPNATTSKPVIQTGTDTPVASPVNTDANVDAARFAKLDSDRDGRVSLSEFTAGYTEMSVASTNEAGMQSGTADAAVVFKQLDADNDTFLSAVELANATEKQLKT
jgi:hypothetical protein